MDLAGRRVLEAQDSDDSDEPAAGEDTKVVAFGVLNPFLKGDLL